MRKTSIVFFETHLNRYSINALLGALETEKLLDKIFVSILNLNQIEEKRNFLKDIIADSEISIFAFSYFTTQVWEVEEKLQVLKNLFKNIRSKEIFFIAGGPHPTGDPVTTLLKGFDFVFIGEAETTFTKFVKKLLSGEDFRKIKGLAYLKENTFVFTGKPDPVSLNKFLPFSLKMRRISPIEITRGCPFGCFFCQTSRLFGKNIRHRSQDTILNIVKSLLEKGLKDMRFISPNAFSYGSDDGRTLNLQALKEFLKNLHELVKFYCGRIFFGSFPSEVRPEHVTEETVGLIKNFADNNNLVIGAQSGSQKILDLCRRGHTVEDVFKAVKLCKKAGLIPKVDFIFGLPGEEEKDIKETIKVMEHLAKMGAIIHAHTFMPLPQTPFASKKPGKIHPEVLKLINRLLGKGFVFGDWKKQEILAEKMHQYLKNSIKLRSVLNKNFYKN